MLAGFTALGAAAVTGEPRPATRRSHQRHFHGHHTAPPQQQINLSPPHDPTTAAAQYPLLVLLPMPHSSTRALSLNWPPRFNWERSPQLLVTTHYSCHCASQHLLAAAEHGPIIRFDQRYKSSVLVHFLVTNAASARDRVSAASSTLPHPQRTHRDSNHCAATTSIRFRQPPPTITLFSRSKRSHCIMTSRFMNDSPVRVFNGPDLCTHGVFLLYQRSRAPRCHESPHTPRTRRSS
jgi:hypothetical protein